MLGLALAACGGGNIESAPAPSGGGGGAADCGKFNIAINPWVGYEASAHVVGYVAKTKLGCDVEYKNVKEEVAWQGMGNGEIDVVIENWGHADLKQKYITEQKTAQEGGSTGNVGDDRLVRAAVDGPAVPGHHRLEQPQQVRRHVQDHRVRRQGPAARRRPVVRHQRRGAGEEPEAELPGGLRRQRGRADPGLPAGRGEQDPADRLLLRAAVVPVRGAAGQGQPAARTPRAATPTRRRSPATTRPTTWTRSSLPSSSSPAARPSR